ncbi:MAG: BRO family protein [Oscillospiraceae bacterium]
MIDNEKENVNNEISIFEHEEFGQIRTIEIDGKIYFVGLDVTNALGYTVNQKALRDHVDEEDKMILSKKYCRDVLMFQNGTLKNFPNRGLTIINESGLYSLVLASKLEGAKKFKRWVTSEVLPTIRKTGTYSMNPPRIEEKSTIYIENLNITNNYIEEKPTRKTSKKYRKGDTKYMVNIEKLKIHLDDYLYEVTTVSDGKIKECPICKSGSGQHKTCAFSIMPNTNRTRWKCFSCNNGGTIIDLYAKLHNIDDKTAIRELSEKYGNKPIQRKPQKIDTNRQEKEFIQKKIIEDIKISQTFVDNSAYMLRRGISKEVLQRFHVGFIPNWIHPNILYKQQFGTDEEKKKYSHVQGTPRAIIPTSDNSYLSRDIRQNNEIPINAQSYTKMKVGETHILNIDALKTNKIVIVVEGEIDALSFISLGYETIGLGSTSMSNQFIEKQYYEIIGERSKTERPILIWALDNDETGRKSTSNALRLCKIHNIPCICVDSNFYGQFKDGNEMMINNRQGLIENINKAIEQAKNFDFNNIEEDTNKHIEIPSDADYIIEDYNPKTRKTILKISAPLLAEYIRTHSNYIFVRNDALEGVTRYWYKNGVYKLISDDELKGHIKSYITSI